MHRQSWSKAVSCTLRWGAPSAWLLDGSSTWHNFQSCVSTFCSQPPPKAADEPKRSKTELVPNQSDDVQFEVAQNLQPRRWAPRSASNSEAARSTLEQKITEAAQRPAGTSVPDKFRRRGRDDPLEQLLAMREQAERSDLPEDVKFSQGVGEWDNVLVEVKRTIKRTKSQKVPTFHAVVCAGNGKGVFGVGVSHGSNAQKISQDACYRAYQNLFPIPLYRGHTLYHRIEHKFRTIQILLMPRPEGFGIVANDLIFELMTLIGIKNISVKVLGRRKNKLNVVTALVQALQKQTTPHDGVEGTGIYMREVYYKSDLPYGLKRGVDIP